MDVVTTDKRTPDAGQPERRDVPAMLWGVTLPWALAASSLIGVALLFVPDLTGMTGASANNAWLTATLVTVVAVLSWAEIGRPFRVANIAAGLWLAASPWLLWRAHAPLHRLLARGGRRRAV